MKMNKYSFIRKLPNGKYRVVSHKGRNLGTYDSKSSAKKRLQQVEYFKHNSADDIVIDISKADDFTYSAVLRLLRSKLNENYIELFQKIFKLYFDKYVLEDEFSEKLILLKTLVKLKEVVDIKIPTSFIKNASAVELGDPDIAARNLSAIIKFLMKRISKENRIRSTMSLRDKILKLDPFEISSKKTPPSASMGQSITLLKNILVGHNVDYIRQVLKNIAIQLSDTNDINNADIVSNTRDEDIHEPTSPRPFYVNMNSDIGVAPDTRAVHHYNYTDPFGDSQITSRDKDLLKNTKPIDTDNTQVGQLTSYLDFWIGGGPAQTGGII